MHHNKKAPESSTSVSSNTAGWEVLLPRTRLRQVSFHDRFGPTHPKGSASSMVTSMGPIKGPCVGLVGLTNHVVAGSNPRVRHGTRRTRARHTDLIRDPTFGLKTLIARVRTRHMGGGFFLLVSTPADWGAASWRVTMIDCHVRERRSVGI